jgi:ABC-type sulfate transport system substrate-binding protein
VIPPVSLRADFPVSVVDKVVDERGSRKIADAYLNYLYTPEAQEISPRISTGRSTRMWRRSMPRTSHRCGC